MKIGPPCYRNSFGHPTYVELHWYTGSGAGMQRSVCADATLLLNSSLNFQADVRALPRVDGWPQTGVDCMAVLDTERKRRCSQCSVDNNPMCQSHRIIVES